MVGESTEFLRVQPELTRHLDMQVAQVKPLLGFRPGVETAFGFFTTSPFPSTGVIAMRYVQGPGRAPDTRRLMHPVRHSGPDAPLPPMVCVSIPEGTAALPRVAGDSRP